VFEKQMIIDKNKLIKIENRQQLTQVLHQAALKTTLYSLNNVKNSAHESISI